MTADLVVPPMPEAGPRPETPRAAPREPAKRSYEEALAEWQATADDRPPSSTEPDITDAQLAAPMRNAAFIAGCGAPDTMRVVVRVAVQRGRAVGVTVRTDPANPTVARCVDDHVRRLAWPSHAKMDVFTSTY